ncbi:hypothetical protein DL767_001096 [Monosporascus sp. MG133]|nr:hypothetical protein DL767_001096 [Monosporascus sp. MG133]
MLLSPRKLRAPPFKEDPFEKRALTSRLIEPGDLASETYQSYKDLHLRLPPTTQNTISSRWVGGGSVVPPSLPNNDLGHHESEEQNTFYDTLPDVIRIPLVEAVRDVELDGWEDEWFARGRFEVENWGPLEEPKMDFVYNWVNGSDEAFRKIRRYVEDHAALHPVEVSVAVGIRPRYNKAPQQLSRNANRDHMHYRLPQMLEKAGLEPPIVNVNVLWTSVDGPETIWNIKCHDFSVDKGFADSLALPYRTMPPRTPISWHQTLLTPSLTAS